MDKENPWGKDGPGKDVELRSYRSMIGSLMYLTASRQDIMFAVCACARHQVTPKECHLHATIVATSTTEAEYVAAASGYRQVLWIQNQMLDYSITKENGIFLLQDKYVGDILKKFGHLDVRSSNTPMDKENPWGKDGPGKDVKRSHTAKTFNLVWMW
nr:hypothetical protein [Tanacetum cinerariifolium]